MDNSEEIFKLLSNYSITDIKKFCKSKHLKNKRSRSKSRGMIKENSKIRVNNKSPPDNAPVHPSTRAKVKANTPKKDIKSQAWWRYNMIWNKHKGELLDIDNIIGTPYYNPKFKSEFNGSEKKPWKLTRDDTRRDAEYQYIEILDNNIIKSRIKKTGRPKSKKVMETSEQDEQIEQLLGEFENVDTSESESESESESGNKNEKITDSQRETLNKFLDNDYEVF